MEDLIQNILKGSQVKIPKHVMKSLFNEFPDAMNIEWFTAEEGFEAVFYESDIEKIVHIDSTGLILDIRTNLQPNKLPEKIHEYAHKQGEIMNAIAIWRNNNINYELIVRDQNLKRYLLIYSTLGELIEKIKL